MRHKTTNRIKRSSKRDEDKSLTCLRPLVNKTNHMASQKLTKIQHIVMKTGDCETYYNYVQSCDGDWVYLALEAVETSSDPTSSRYSKKTKPKYF